MEIENQTRLSFLTDLVKQMQTKMLYKGGNHVLFSNNWERAEYLAIGGPTYRIDNEDVIRDFSYEEIHSSVISKVFPRAKGPDNTNIVLRYPSFNVPSDYVIDSSEGSMTKISTRDSYLNRIGVRDHALSISDIVVEEGEVDRAIDLMANRSMQYLDENSVPEEVLEFEILNPSAFIEPLTIIRVEYHNPTNDLTIDDHYYVLSTDWTSNSETIYPSLMVSLSNKIQNPVITDDALMAELTKRTLDSLNPIRSTYDPTSPVSPNDASVLVRSGSNKRYITISDFLNL